MSGLSVTDDPLAGWDPRRRQALERLWDKFSKVGPDMPLLSDELIAERRAEAEIEDRQATQE
jgi:hypothetical protein